MNQERSEWQTFDRRSAGRHKRPTITIQRQGTISLNEAAARLVSGDEDPNGVGVLLMFNEGNKQVGVKRAPADHPNPYPLRGQKGSQMYLVSARMFCEHFDIPTEQARRYRARKLEDGIVGFALDDDYAKVGRRKKKNGNGHDEGDTEE